MMLNLIPDEQPEAQRAAYLKSLARSNGQNPPPYDPEAAVGDFWQAAGEVIAKRPPRRIYNPSNEHQSPPTAVLSRYMPLWKFASMMTTGSLYFCRVDSFIDQLEGRQRQALWSHDGPEARKWYEDNCKQVFVYCLHLADDESSFMWQEYTKDDRPEATKDRKGVMFRTTVAKVKRELSEPELPPPPAPPPEFEPYAVLGFQLGDDAMNAPPHDAFTVGEVKYIDHDGINLHQELAKSLSNTRPMFVKINKYVNELEYRAILRPGSSTGEGARRADKKGINMPVRLDRLIEKITFAPVDDTDLENAVRELVSKAGLNVPITRSSLDLHRSDLQG
jgi:hypothetical protein